MADCDPAKDIKSNSDGTYTYSRSCHVMAGKAIKEKPLLNEQVDDLNKAITLKDLALTQETQRSTMWLDDSVKMHDKLNSYEAAEHKSNVIYFILGIVVTGAAVYGAGQLVRH